MAAVTRQPSYGTTRRAEPAVAGPREVPASSARGSTGPSRAPSWPPGRTAAGPRCGRHRRTGHRRVARTGGTHEAARWWSNCRHGTTSACPVAATAMRTAPAGQWSRPWRWRCGLSLLRVPSGRRPPGMRGRHPARAPRLGVGMNPRSCNSRRRVAARSTCRSACRASCPASRTASSASPTSVPALRSASSRRLH